VLTSGCSLLTMVPFGRVMRAGGTFAPTLGTSARPARQSNNCGHFRGFLALATFPSELSDQRVGAIS